MLEDLIIGSEYRKKDLWIGQDKPPTSGQWITGNSLLVFCNIGTPGAFGIDYPNKYDKATKRVTWYGSKGSHSDQPEFKGLINGEVTHYFFARWEKNDNFTFLGVGKRLFEYEDNVELPKGGTTIKMIYSLGHYAVGNNEKKVYIDL